MFYPPFYKRDIDGITVDFMSQFKNTLLLNWWRLIRPMRWKRSNFFFQRVWILRRGTELRLRTFNNNNNKNNTRKRMRINKIVKHVKRKTLKRIKLQILWKVLTQIVIYMDSFFFRYFAHSIAPQIRNKSMLLRFKLSVVVKIKFMSTEQLSFVNIILQFNVYSERSMENMRFYSNQSDSDETLFLEP